MTRLTAALLVVCVLVAGCGAGPTATPTETPPDTETPAGTATPTGATPDTGTSTETAAPTPGVSERLADRELPAGLSPGGVENASALLSTHRDRLAETGAVVRIEQRSAVDATETTTVRTRRIGADGTLLIARTVDSDRSQVSSRTYYDGERVFVNQSFRSTTYSVFSSPTYVERIRENRQLTRFVALANLTVASVDADEGTVTLRAGTPDASALRRGGSAVEVRNVTARAVVDLDGVVREFTLDANLSTDEFTNRVRIDYAVQRRGLDAVEAPDWTETARGEAVVADVSATVVNDTVRITHDGGDEIPAGSQLIAIQRNESGAVTGSVLVETREPISAGETITVYRTPGSRYGGEIERGAVTPEDAGALNGSVTVQIAGPDGAIIDVVEADRGERDSD